MRRAVTRAEERMSANGGVAFELDEPRILEIEVEATRFLCGTTDQYFAGCGHRNEVCGNIDGVSDHRVVSSLLRPERTRYDETAVNPDMQVEGLSRRVLIGGLEVIHRLLHLECGVQSLGGMVLQGARGTKQDHDLVANELVDVAPYRAATAPSRSKQALIVLRTTSALTVSLIAVKPVMSANKTVTCLNSPTSDSAARSSSARRALRTSRAAAVLSRPNATC